MNPPELVPLQTSITVGTSVVDIAPLDKTTKRLIYVFSNTSSGGQSISLGIGQDAVAGKGIVLSPGGVWQESVDNRYDPSNLRLTAVASGAGGTLAVFIREVPT